MQGKKRDAKGTQKESEETFSRRLQRISQKMMVAKTNLDNLPLHKEWVKYEIMNNCHYLMTLKSLSTVCRGKFDIYSNSKAELVKQMLNYEKSEEVQLLAID
jgi:hypothetical protein